MSAASVSSSSTSVDFGRNTAILFDMANSPGSRWNGPIPKPRYWMFDDRDGTIEEDEDTDHEMEDFMASCPSIEQSISFPEPDPIDVHFDAKEEHAGQEEQVVEEEVIDEEQLEPVAEPEPKLPLHPIEIQLLRRKAEYLARQQLQVRSVPQVAWGLGKHVLTIFLWTAMAVAYILPVIAVFLGLEFDTRYIQDFLENWAPNSVSLCFSEYYASIHSGIVSFLRYGDQRHAWIPVFQYQEPAAAWYVGATVGVWKYLYGWI